MPDLFVWLSYVLLFASVFMTYFIYSRHIEKRAIGDEETLYSERCGVKVGLNVTTFPFAKAVVTNSALYVITFRVREIKFHEISSLDLNKGKIAVSLFVTWSRKRISERLWIGSCNCRELHDVLIQMTKR